MQVDIFVKHLINLVKKERKLQIEAMKREIARMPPKKREKVGRAILNLRGKVLGSYFGHVYVRYGRSQDIVSEISQGDVVLVSRMNSNPLKSGISATVVEKGRKFITVAMKSLPDWALKNVRIDLYSSETTFNRMLDNLRDLNERGRRALEIYLGIRKPEVRSCDFQPLDELNESQVEAISFAICSECFAIHGPFGTGKTRTASELVRQLVKRGEKVLATASSNVAVDNFLLATLRLGGIGAVRLGHPARIDKKVMECSLFYQLEKHERYSEVKELSEKIDELTSLRDMYDKPKPKLRRGLSDEEILRAAERGRALRGLTPRQVISMAEWIRLNSEVEKLVKERQKVELEIQKEIVEEADVVFATNSTAYLLKDYGLEFETTIIDEATQATIPEVLIPVSLAERFVLAGDHKQLPPTVEVRELEKTLFENVVKVASSMLRVQYRMNEELMEFPCKKFYGCMLRADESVKELRLGFSGKIVSDRPLQFIDTSECDNRWERQRRGSFSRENRLEAEIVRAVVKELSDLDLSRVGVITPYDDQADLIRSLVCEEMDVEINTVDAFQGREKDIIVISFVRSNPEGKVGFLMDERRLNVAITRARMKLICIGDSSTLSSLPLYAELVDHFRKKGDFVSAKELGFC